MRWAILNITAMLFFFGCSGDGSEGVLSSPSESGNQQTEVIDPLTCAQSLKLLTPSEEELELYPDTGLPRIVIATESMHDPSDETTEKRAHALIYKGGIPVSDTLELTIRGRGNTTFSMPKKSYKLSFTDKVEILGMPGNKDWALLANYGDKTLLKNYTAFKISEWLGAPYTPRSQFVELFLNGSFRGLYQLVETIKVGKNRVNIPETGNSYLVEIDRKYRNDEEVVFNEAELAFRIHYPKDPSEETKERLRLHLDSLEAYLEYIHQDYTLALDSTPDHWFDITSFVRHYWIQEFTKNPDAIPLTSVFFTWNAGSVIRMGPVWDFDAAFGSTLAQADAEGWYIRDYSWYRRLSKAPNVRDSIISFWEINRPLLAALPDSIDAYAQKIAGAAHNNFLRWPEILDNIDEFTHTQKYESFEEAVEDLNVWIRNRTLWISKNVQKI